MKRIFVVRHGNTFAPGETPRRIGARTDLPLVAGGLVQAEQLGRWFAGRGIAFSAALSGPLARASRTAQAILACQPHPPSLAIVDWLTEIDHGIDENRQEHEVVARIGQAALTAWDRDAVPPPGWLVQAESRTAAWRQLLRAPGHAATLVVTSNGAARFVFAALPELRRPDPLKLRTGAYAEIVERPDGTFALAGWDVRP